MQPVTWNRLHCTPPVNRVGDGDLSYVTALAQAFDSRIGLGERYDGTG
jgi:hypothetical protein